MAANPIYTNTHVSAVNSDAEAAEMWRRLIRLLVTSTEEIEPELRLRLVVDESDTQVGRIDDESVGDDQIEFRKLADLIAAIVERKVRAALDRRDREEIGMCAPIAGHPPI